MLSVSDFGVVLSTQVDGLSLKSVEYCVCDEADRLFEMGFLEQVGWAKCAGVTRVDGACFTACLIWHMSHGATAMARSLARCLAFEPSPLGNSSFELSRHGIGILLEPGPRVGILINCQHKPAIWYSMVN